MISAPVSAWQYAITAEILLALSSSEPQIDGSNRPLDVVQKLAIRVCGIAFTNEDLGATLNGFGPLLFCEFLLIGPIYGDKSD